MLYLGWRAWHRLEQVVLGRAAVRRVQRLAGSSSGPRSWTGRARGWTAVGEPSGSGPSNWLHSDLLARLARACGWAGVGGAAAPSTRDVSGHVGRRRANWETVTLPNTLVPSQEGCPLSLRSGVAADMVESPSDTTITALPGQDRIVPL
jgi:hypothetical protein